MPLLTSNMEHPFKPYVYFTLTQEQRNALNFGQGALIDTMVQNYNMVVWYNVTVYGYNVDDVLNNISIRDTAQNIVAYLAAFNNPFNINEINEENTLDFVPGIIYPHFVG